MIRTENIKTNRVLFISSAVLLLLAIFLLGLHFLRPDSAYTDTDLDTSKALPQNNWVVCEDLDVGEIPGIEPAQRFRLCHPAGNRLLAYCLDRDVTPPPVGTSCELLDKDTFWCGDDYQRLRPYTILRTPPPPTNTPRVTLTQTLTATHMATENPREEKTPYPSETPTATAPPPPTPTSRPPMGGDGNLQFGDLLSWTLGMLFLGLSLVIMGSDWKKHRSTKQQ